MTGLKTGLASPNPKHCMLNHCAGAMGYYPNIGRLESDSGTTCHFTPPSFPGWRCQTGTKGFPSDGKEHPSRSQVAKEVTVIMNIYHSLTVQSPNAESHWPFKITGLTMFLGCLLILAAFAPPVQAVVVQPGTKVLLTWTSLGSGTTYYVQTSTNLATWTTATNTPGTNVTLSYNVNNMRAFRLWASNAPPQSASLAWNASVPATGIAGYYIHYGTTSGNYTNRIDAGLASTSVVNNLLVGVTYYFVTTAYTALGMESGYSNETVWQNQLTPQTALQLNIKQLP